MQAILKAKKLCDYQRKCGLSAASHSSDSKKKKKKFPVDRPMNTSAQEVKYMLPMLEFLKNK